ncbi:MAG: SDR family oxidoreductase [Myxococcota bacterium]|nr:SDR family oxidoreductase [Myxococcota bacterium]
MDLGLSGRTALVTGSSRGTGAGIARVLAREGVRVLVHGIEAGQAEAVTAELREAGGDVASVSGDVRSDEGARCVAEAVAAQGGGVDVLVNNYGLAEGGGWSDGDSDDWLRMFETNVLSGVRMVRHLLPGMKERGWGRILFVSTVGSRRPRAQMPGYYASKASLANMTVSLCKELAGTGITVNTISPGILATAEVRAMLERRAEKEGWGTSWEETQRVAARDFMPNPTGRIGRVDEVGALVAFLASDLAGYINGADIRIDGGAADCV